MSKCNHVCVYVAVVNNLQHSRYGQFSVSQMLKHNFKNSAIAYPAKNIWQVIQNLKAYQR